MANPSSFEERADRDRERERDRDRERERELRRQHRSDRERAAAHHHRTISSTTLLLVLSLILAVLAVVLSLPNSAAQLGGNAAAGIVDDGSAPSGILGLLTPKRSQALISREHQVAMREAEVAKREAELLAGAPGGVLNVSPACPVCPEVGPVQTIYKEIQVPATADAMQPWQKEAGIRLDDILDRELKIAEREREISKREENVNKREHDASRRESWIMEQLIVLGNDYPVEEEFVYEPKRIKERVLIDDRTYERLDQLIHTVTETMPPSTVTVPAPANTRKAAFPIPDGKARGTPLPTGPKTTEIYIEAEPLATTVITRGRKTSPRPPARWFGAW